MRGGAYSIGSASAALHCTVCRRRAAHAWPGIDVLLRLLDYIANLCEPRYLGTLMFNMCMCDQHDDNRLIILGAVYILTHFSTVMYLLK